MVVLIESKTIIITEALRAMATRQARKLFHFGASITKVRITLDTIARKKNDSQAAVVQYSVELPGKDVVVRRRAKDIYLAITEAAAHAARSVRKMKEKKLSIRRQRRAEVSSMDALSF